MKQRKVWRTLPSLHLRHMTNRPCHKSYCHLAATLFYLLLFRNVKKGTCSLSVSHENRPSYSQEERNGKCVVNYQKLINVALTPTEPDICIQFKFVWKVGIFCTCSGNFLLHLPVCGDTVYNSYTNYQWCKIKQ